jgi:UDP-N-acetylglucosamine--N-acetylmuramyl-(pentapeptide) pyrophosphoryl-undecaprenol N-acetylglucosamine transferase
LLCGGGTGGHVYPALAVAAALSDSSSAEGAPQHPVPGIEHVRLIYIGSIGGMEQGIIKSESALPFRALPAAAVRGRGLADLARSGVVLGRGIVAALALLRELRPAAILGTGGYVCVPLFIAAWMARVPTLIYLPDVVPGLAIRLLARIATHVACNVEDSATYLRIAKYELRLENTSAQTNSGNSKLVVVGYPVRAALFNQDKAPCRSAFGLDGALPVLLVYGGSRGARSINQAVATLLPDLLEQSQIIHVCGREGDEQFLRDAANRLPPELRKRYRLYPYLESGDEAIAKASDDDQGISSSVHAVAKSMVRAFGAADLALCRSGASTLAELPAAALPAILVPYPYVHQDENADYLVRHGAAVKVADSAMLGGGRPQDGPLFQNICRLLDNRCKRQHMAEQSHALARPDAARLLANVLLGLTARSVS